MEYLAYSEVISKSSQGLLGIVLAAMGLGAVGFAACWMVMSGVVIVLDAVWLRRYCRVRLRTSRRRLVDMARESVSYWAFGLFFLVYLWIDATMLSLMTEPKVVAWYGVPTKLFQTLMFVPVVVSTAWLPRLVEAFEQDSSHLARTARMPVGLVLRLGIPIGAAVVIAAQPMIDLVYGPAYAQAAPVLAILGLCIPPMYVNILLNQVLVAAKRQVAWTWVMGGATIVNPLINLALISVTQAQLGNGAIGAAISLLLTELLIVAVGFVLAGAEVLGREGARRGALAAAASLGMYAAAYVTRSLGTVPSLAAAALAFAILGPALRIAGPEEVAFARVHLARIARRIPALRRLAQDNAA